MIKKTIIAQSPGRINIIGEHTDYNDGFVLPAAIDKKTTFKLSRNGNDNKEVHIIAKDLEEQFSFKLDDFSPLSKGWQNYVMGVIHELQKMGAKLSGFDGEFSGDVPIGSGMSSSAALECSLAYGLNELFDLQLDNWQLIKVAQLAEHNFAGIKCGIMDQFASVMGKKNQVMLLDTQSLDFQYFPFDLGAYQLLLLNSNVTHSLASSAYNTRRNECQESIEVFQNKKPEVKSLREVSLDMLLQFKAELSDIQYRRSHHVVSENGRVLDATKALVNKDFQRLGKLMYASHYSLKDNYEVSCPELDYLVALTLDKEEVLGSRMMGGGFGGCTINIIHKKKVNSFIEFASQKYLNRFNKNLTPYQVNIEDGTNVTTSSFSSKIKT